MSELELRNQQLHPDSAAHLESSLPAEVMSLKEPQVAQVRPLKPLYLTRPPRHVSVNTSAATQRSACRPGTDWSRDPTPNLRLRLLSYSRLRYSLKHWSLNLHVTSPHFSTRQEVKSHTEEATVKLYLQHESL